jgi:hypothetical protein
MVSLREQEDIAARALEFAIEQARFSPRRRTKWRAMFQPCPVYRRSDAIVKRRKLMEPWAAYCEQTDVANNVDGQAADQSEANGDAGTTRRYSAVG